MDDKLCSRQTSLGGGRWNPAACTLKWGEVVTLYKTVIHQREESILSRHIDFPSITQSPTTKWMIILLLFRNSSNSAGYNNIYLFIFYAAGVHCLRKGASTIKRLSKENVTRGEGIDFAAFTFKSQDVNGLTAAGQRSTLLERTNAFRPR